MQISPADAAAYAAVEAAAKTRAAWLKTQHEDGGIPAEKAILDCLRTLQSIPQADRVYADRLMDSIARLFMTSSPDIPAERRRGFALLSLAGEVPE